jgi:type I restriction enzyme S subunit
MTDQKVADWATLRLGDVLTHRKERAQPGDPLLSVTSDRGVVPQSESGRRDVSSVNKYAYWRVYPGDIVYNTMRMWQGVSGRSDHFGMVSPAYTVCSPQARIDTHFLAYVLKLPELIAVFKNRSQGLVSDTWNLKYRSFAQIPFSIPSYQEQQRIAQILDTAVQGMQSAEQLIAKLELAKQGVLRDLLTRGIDRSGQLRNPERQPDLFVHTSLGILPRPWKVLKVSSIADVFNGSTPSRLRDDYWKGGSIPWLSSGKVNDYDIVSPSELITERAFIDCSLRLLPVDAVVVGMIGEGRTRGMAARLCIPATINQNLAGIVPSNSVSGKFLHLVLADSYDALRRWGRGSNQDALNTKLVGDFRIPVPEIQEQRTIIDFAASLESEIEAECRELAKLHSLKEGLLHDLLTGQVKVGDST